MRHLIVTLAAIGLIACNGAGPAAADMPAPDDPRLIQRPDTVPDSAASIVVAGGCFWCVESDFEQRADVYEAISGYSGGSNVGATYRDHEGHREAVEIFYDPSAVSYAELAAFFMRTIDPTDRGGQFCDRGYEYSTAIYPRTDAEEAAANTAIADAEAALSQAVVTAVDRFQFIVRAEDYHQNYYKSDETVATRFGLVKRKDAYKRYRKGCRRDARLAEVWGASTP